MLFAALVAARQSYAGGGRCVRLGPNDSYRCRCGSRNSLVLQRARDLKPHLENRVADHVKRPQVAIPEGQIARVYGGRDLTEEFAFGRIHQNTARRDKEIALCVRPDSIRTAREVCDDRALVSSLA